MNVRCLGAVLTVYTLFLLPSVLYTCGGRIPPARPTLHVPGARLWQGRARGSDHQSYPRLRLFRVSHRSKDVSEAFTEATAPRVCRRPCPAASVPQTTGHILTESFRWPRLNCGQSLPGSCPFPEPCSPDFRLMLNCPVTFCPVPALIKLTGVRFGAVQLKATAHRPLQRAPYHHVLSGKGCSFLPA